MIAALTATLEWARNNPKLVMAACVTVLFVMLFGLESLLPLRRPTRSRRPRVAVNLLVSAVVFAVGGLVLAPLGRSVAAWASGGAFGLVHLMDLPQPARVAVSVVLMDLTFYYWHAANHRFGLLWRFHNVHHSDPDMDVSTCFRFHWGEMLLSAPFRVVQVALIGVTPLTYALHEFVFQCCTLFHHSNARLPLGLERLLNLCLVTPRMHGVHHSAVAEEGNTNYSVVFPWWDRLHRTLRLNIPQAEVIVGVPAYSRDEDNHFWRLMAAPFTRQRPYSLWPDGSTARREAPPAGAPTAMAD